MLNFGRALDFHPISLKQTTRTRHHAMALSWLVTEKVDAKQVVRQYSCMSIGDRHWLVGELFDELGGYGDVEIPVLV